VFDMSNQYTTSATQSNVIHHPMYQEPQSPTGLAWFKDVFRKQFSNFQDWVNFVAILIAIITVIWGIFTWSIDSRFDAMDKKLDAVNLQNQANYEKISAEIRGGNLDVQKSIQDLDYQQKILGLELKKKK
jgi:hypothetical protein